MQEVVVFLHDKPCPYRIHELDDTGEEEHHSGDETTEALQAQKEVSHVFIVLLLCPLRTGSLQKSRQAAASDRFHQNNLCV